MINIIILNQRLASLDALGYDCDTSDGEITNWRDSRPQPEWDEIIALAAPILAAQKSRNEGREALRVTWDALPTIYRGPYRPEFEAANRLLDEGDDEGAAAIITYSEPKQGYSEAEILTFNTIKSQMAASIASLAKVEPNNS